MSKCDGCARGLPLDEDGWHHDGAVNVMSCTADKREDTPTPIVDAILDAIERDHKDWETRARAAFKAAAERIRTLERELADAKLDIRIEYQRVERLRASLTERGELLREALDWWEKALKMMRLIVPNDLQWKVEEQTKRIAEIRAKLEKANG